MKLNLNKQNFPKFLFFISLSLLTVLLIIKVFTYSIYYDDAYNVSIAKNIAYGFGYVSSYENFVYFNSEITTGPTLILPAAIFIKIFGNEIWIPQLIPALFFIIGIIVIAKLNPLNSYRKTFLVLTLFILLNIVLIPTINLFSFLGELPSGILIIISSILISRLGSKNLFIAGIVFALAILTKTIVALFLPSVIGAIVLFYINKNGLKKHTLIQICKYSGVFILGFSSLYLAYSFLKTVFTVDFPQNSNKLSEAEFFLQASGLKNLVEKNGVRAKINYIKDNIFNSFNNLSIHLGSGITAFFFLLTLFLIIISLIIKSYRDRNYSKYYISITALSLNVLLHLFWWFIISHDGWIRHLGQVFTYTAFLISIYVVILYKKKIVILLLILLFAIIFGRFNDLSLWFNFNYRDRLIPLLETADYLEKLKEKDNNAILAGCGWWANRDLEYTMNGVLNFRDCHLMEDSFFKDKKVYLVRSEIFNWGNDIFNTKFAELCDKEVIYTNNMFKVSRCYGRPQ